MSFARICCLALLLPGFCVAQVQTSSPTQASLTPQTILPITFTRNIRADRARPGAIVEAKTIQRVRLSNGQEIEAGAQVLGHVSKAEPFVYNKTPYAQQSQAELAIQFDTLVTRGEKIPLHVYLRAIADTFATEAAFEPRPSDEDPLHRTTQVGGEILTPSQNEIVSWNGDTVGYNKHGGNFAHLIANGGTGAVQCDASTTEQPVSMFSASACGAYGFKGMELTSTGYGSQTSEFSFSSNRRTPAIYRSSSALLEVVPDTSIASR